MIGDAQRQAYRTFDGQRGAEITLDATAAEPLDLGGDATQNLARTLIRYQSVLCAEAVGAMEEALRLTTEYLMSRKQFGVPLKNFQTLTQRAADMYVSLELARSMNFYAAMSIADGVYDRWSPRGPNCRSGDPGGTSLRRPSNCTAASA